MNVTDMTFGPDGAMYFTTGGRKTQSGLYRVSYIGAREAEKESAPSNARAAELRKLRRKLEEFHGREVKGAVEIAWPYLDHPDRFVRYAARVAVEAQPLNEWQEKAFSEDTPVRAFSALLALARVAPAEMQGRLLARLQQFDLNPLNADLRLEAVRICQVACMRMGHPDAQVSAAAGAYFEPFYPSRSTPLNHELCRLLTYLGFATVLEKTIALARDSRSSEDLLHYLWHLRQVKDGWKLEHRRIAFEALARAEQLQGAREYYQALRDIRKDFSDALTDTERDALREVIAPATGPAFTLPAIDWSKYGHGQSWKLPDFSPEDLARRGNVEQGREAYAAAQCIQCHRFGNEPGGTMGPDLGSVASRFGRRDILQHILEPSLAIDDKSRNTVVTLKNGSSYVGLLQEEDDKQVRLASGATPDDVVVLDKTLIVSRESSPVSPMPPGLLNILSKEQIADLLAYLESSVSRR
jgi:putative heme-binding domain-containing protein